MKLSDFLAPLDALLRQHRIRYAIIGGYAVAAWGEARATRDVDLLCSAGDMSLLIEALIGAGLRSEHRSGDSDDPISDVVRIDMGAGDDPYEIDVLFNIRDSPQGILDRVRTIQVEGLALPIASPEDTIILKLLGGSPRDLEDATSIVQVQNVRLDLSLIRQICPEYLRGTLERMVGI